MPQHYGLFPHLTALENVIAGLDHLQSSARERIARIWMEKVHLDGLESRRPASMSGGQQQRVALARALARDPAILLLDEPFSSVDRATRETLYQELATLKTQLKIPTILVTHDLNEALLLADRMTLIAQGQTLQSGIPSDVMANPTNETAARLLGIRNLFDGEILRHDLKAGLTWIKAGDQSLACMLAAQWNPGAKVRWMVPNSGVRLRAISNGDLPSSHNRVRLRTLTLLPLGDHAHITASTLGMHEPLHLQLPLRLATELEMKPGATVDAVLREDSLRILQSV
ncbi:MAG: ABC transporter ATP-binding protein [Gammaproteobacteria bacterium]